jgi:hypothetical protein
MSDGQPNVGMGGMVVYKPVVNTAPGARIAAHNPVQSSGAPVEEVDDSVGSIQSIGSVGSILSIGSVGSVLSIGSAGSVLSIGSAGSILSIGSVGSIASLGSGFSVGAIGGWSERPGALVETASTALAVAALVVAATRA